MKLRTLDNSIRLRLSQTEVNTLRSDGQVSAETWVTPDHCLRYEVVRSDCETMGAELDGTVLRVWIPGTEAKQWADSDAVSLRSEQPTRGGAVLKILVEKDFACLAPREDEDEADLFPHPQTGKATC